jgi:hypothetical protein
MSKSYSCEISSLFPVVILGQHVLKIVVHIILLGDKIVLYWHAFEKLKALFSGGESSKHTAGVIADFSEGSDVESLN